MWGMKKTIRNILWGKYEKIFTFSFLSVVLRIIVWNTNICLNKNKGRHSKKASKYNETTIVVNISIINQPLDNIKLITII